MFKLIKCLVDVSRDQKAGVNFAQCSISIIIIQRDNDARPLGAFPICDSTLGRISCF